MTQHDKAIEAVAGRLYHQRKGESAPKFTTLEYADKRLFLSDARDIIAAYQEAMKPRYVVTEEVTDIAMKPGAVQKVVTQKVLSDGWRPIETAPKDGSYIIGYHPPPSPQEFEGPTSVVVVHWQDRTGGGFWAYKRKDNFAPLYTITHWMPLPKPPKEKG
jgi:hypothetical protein